MKKLKKIKLSESSEMLNDFQMKNILGGSGTECQPRPQDYCGGTECNFWDASNLQYVPGRCSWAFDWGNYACRCSRV